MSLEERYYEAVENYNPEKSNPIIEQLIQEGLDINKTDEDVETPLIKAINYSKIEHVKFLLEHGADINKPDCDGITPLMYEIADEKIELVKFFLEHGADVNIKDNDGDSALHCAARTYDSNIIRLIADKVADINAQNNDGETALHIIADYNNPEEDLNTMQMLVDDYKADSSIEDKNGWKAFDIYRVKLENKDKDEFSDDDGYSEDDFYEIRDRKYYQPLKRAIIDEDIKKVKFLVEKIGINPDRYITFHPDKTAIYVAYETGNDEIVKYLVEQGVRLIQPSDFAEYPFDYGIKKKLNEYARQLILEQIAENQKEKKEKEKEEKEKEEEEEDSN